ncbi:hypothetical protein OF83DRAFT_876080 [Amylostereum chailletii]|nr:hypothetical protein OF83DRAFT_876080 [Amylostereum chailletii]
MARALSMKEETLRASFYPTSTQAELDLWQNLAFSFDMDSKQQGSSVRHPTSSSRTRSASNPSSAGHGAPDAHAPHGQGAGPNSFRESPNIPFPPSSSAAPHSYEAIANALRTLQESLPYLPTPSINPYPTPNNQQPPYQQPYPSPSFDNSFPWTSVQDPGRGAAPLDLSSLLTSAGQQAPSLSNAPSQTPNLSVTPITSLDWIDADDESTSPVDTEIGVTEDKRRRNTAASARFRIKKKQKTLNLERTVSDLTGRVDELEQEASDLRRENGWLKEIVMLKSRRPDTAFAFEGSKGGSHGAGEPGGRSSQDDKGEGSSKK